MTINGRSIGFRVTLSGPDTNMVKYVQNGPKDVALLAIKPVDYEAPADHNQDNVYEIIQTATTNSVYVQQSQRVISSKYKLQVTDKAGDASTVVNPSATGRQGPEYSRLGDQITLQINEGSQVIFEIKNLVLAGSVQFLGNVLQNAVTGRDAGDVQIRQTATGTDPLTSRTARDFILEFTSVPDFDNPTDDNRDSQYEFAFDGALATAMGALAFDVQVLDVV